ncbi:hypothetical protein RclHR1_16570004 [Rhizophagus clarus]|uniref:Uncharacterized protein n=1 Tax=Rhizophagus clarus TaxID=94130 RepID=A0A2Z6QV88_9GLOM|nr:hypothetical protein RclHR1_16570004 [Rhizophagus clarus]
MTVKKKGNIKRFESKSVFQLLHLLSSNKGYGNTPLVIFQYERTAPSQVIFGTLSIKAVKHFEIGGKASIIVFFEKYEDVEISSFTASQNKKSKDSSDASKKSKTVDSSKKTKNSSSSKTYSTNSKPNKDKTRTSKKSKDKKKMKSSGKKTDDKMDIVKLLLTLISKI